MNVAIVNLTSGGISGGYRKYLKRMIPLLCSDPRITNLDIFLPEAVAGDPCLQDDGSRTCHIASLGASHTSLKAELRRIQPDVVFIPTARWLHCGPIPVVSMVRNMEPLAVPFGGNSPLEGFRNLARSYAARTVCRRSRRVIAVSYYVRDFLIRRWNLSPGRVGVVYHGVEPPPGRPQTKKPGVLEGRAFDGFLFTAGSIRPARGLGDLIRAFSTIRREGMKISLVIAGEADPACGSYKERMQRLEQHCGVASQVLWVGELDPREMSWCFYNCSAFIMTSRAEACPNLALEAMSHGCLCVSTNQQPMPEIFGPSAFYYQAGDASSLSSQLTRTLGATDFEARQKKLAAASRAGQFEWSATAKATVAQLELALK